MFLLLFYTTVVKNKKLTKSLYRTGTIVDHFHGHFTSIHDIFIFIRIGSDWLFLNLSLKCWTFVLDLYHVCMWCSINKPLHERLKWNMLMLNYVFLCPNKCSMCHFFVWPMILNISSFTSFVFHSVVNKLCCSYWL